MHERRALERLDNLQLVGGAGLESRWSFHFGNQLRVELVLVATGPFPSLLAHPILGAATMC